MNLKKIADAAKFSREEMFKDYEAVDSYGMSLADKKAMGAKYGIESKKADEIKKAILIAMRDERKTREIFDLADIKAFGRLSDYPEQYKKLAMYLAEEPRDFVEYLADFYYIKLEKAGLTKKFNVEVPINTVGYGLSYADKAMINRYANTKRFLNESTEEFKSAKQTLENTLDAIKAKLDSELVKFKQLYIEKAKSFADRMYTWAEENKDRLATAVDKSWDAIKECERRLHAEGLGYREVYNHPEKRALQDKYEDYRKAYNQCRTILRSSREEYLAEAEKDAEAVYERNVRVLAEKINAWGVNANEMVVDEVADDPKFFEIRVSDGVHNLYARSIWAAEYSDKVTPHFRFIITEKKSRR